MNDQTTMKGLENVQLGVGRFLNSFGVLNKREFGIYSHALPFHLAPACSPMLTTGFDCVLRHFTPERA